ncbi:MAG: CBS domain-containing protein, partial [Bacteroidia bacterium]
DKDAAVMTRRIPREEGIFAGNSAGSAMAGLVQIAHNFKEGDVVVVIFHDHGTRYLGKMFNDDWMRDKGYLDRTGMTANDLVAAVKSAPLKSLETTDTLETAAKIMSANDYSQLPVTQSGRIVGSLNEQVVVSMLMNGPETKATTLDKIMQPAFPFVDSSTPVESLSAMITAENPAVLVRDFKTDNTFIITRHDIMRAMV